MTIEAYTGLPGQGKTYLMVRAAYFRYLKYSKIKKEPPKWIKKFMTKKMYFNNVKNRLQLRNRKIYSNIRIDLPNVIYYEQVEELFDVYNADILLDEASLIAPAGYWQAIPFEVMQHWREHRHKGVNLWYTAQELIDVATALRRVTQFVNDVERFGPFNRWTCTNPRSKAKYGGGLILHDANIAKLYAGKNKKGVAKQKYLDSTHGSSPAKFQQKAKPSLDELKQLKEKLSSVSVVIGNGTREDD